MKDSKRSKQVADRTPHSKEALEAHWERAASFYEGPQSLGVLGDSTPLTAAAARRLIGRGKKKAISVRMPEIDIDALKRIAALTESKYQRLIVSAVERFIDIEEQRLFLNVTQGNSRQRKHAKA